MTSLSSPCPQTPCRRWVDCIILLTLPAPWVPSWYLCTPVQLCLQAQQWLVLHGTALCWRTHIWMPCSWRPERNMARCCFMDCVAASSPSLFLHPIYRAAGIISSLHILCGRASGGSLVLLPHWGGDQALLGPSWWTYFWASCCSRGLMAQTQLVFTSMGNTEGCHSSFFYNSDSYVEDFALPAFFFCARLSKPMFFCF